MKSIRLIILFNLLLLSSINAQSQKFELGIIGGTNLSNLYGSEFVKKYKPKLGISQGITFQYNINNRFSINSKLLFERKGYWADDEVMAYNSPEFGGPGDFKLINNFDYISLPIAARVHFGKKVKFFVNAGPTFSYLIDHTQIQTKTSSNRPRGYISRGYIFKFLGEYNSFDIGFLGGAGILIPFNNQLGMTIEGGHNLGLTNISKSDKFKNSSSFALLGINYKL